jgi:hypothetical protein
LNYWKANEKNLSYLRRWSMKTVLSSKRRHYVARVGTFLIVVALIAGMVGCGCTTTPSQNLEIRDWYDLDSVRDNLAGNHTLMNDLDSTTAGYTELASLTANQGKGWEPIKDFTGTFDGQGYEIRDLFSNRPDEMYVGLFGLVDEGGVIEDVGVVNATVTGYVSVGGLVGENNGTVSNSYSSGDVTGGAESYDVGGLVGENNGTVSGSYSTGSVTGEEKVGGLVGGNYWGGTVSNSYSSGSVTGNSSVGGLMGANIAAVSDSFWDTQTSGQATSDGGTGKNTTEMQDIATFTAWDIIEVANPSIRNPSYIWNIVNNVTYPFLSWQS